MLDMKVKGLFFNRRVVVRAVSRAKRKALSLAGGLVRKTSQRSIRKARRMRLGEMPQEQREGFRVRQRIAKDEGRPLPKPPLVSSKPGEPPRGIVGLLRKWILYAYEPQSEGVVVGPVKLNSGSNAPEILEHGGTTTFPFGPLRGQRVDIEARPFMGPALEKTVSKIPPAFRNTVKEGA